VTEDASGGCDLPIPGAKQSMKATNVTTYLILDTPIPKHLRL
jgi:hypothetical protein